MPLKMSGIRTGLKMSDKAANVKENNLNKHEELLLQ